MRKWNKMILTDFLLILILISVDLSFTLAFISIIIHECSHIIIAKVNGCGMDKFRMNFYGTNAVLADIDEVSNWEKLQIYLAGPIANCIIVCMCIVIKNYYNTELINLLLNVNLGLAVFNLLPAYPLDGARILEVILSRKILYKKANNIICIMSIITALILIINTVIVGIRFKNINITLIASAAIIFYFTNEERKASTYIAMGNIYKKRNTLIRNNYIETKAIAVYYKQDMINLMRLLDKNKFNYFLILNDDLNIMFSMFEDELIEALKNYGNITLEDYYKVHK